MFGLFAKHTKHFYCLTRENARGYRPHTHNGVKPCVKILYFSSNEHVLRGFSFLVGNYWWLFKNVAK